MRADEAGLERLDLRDVVGAGLERLAADAVVEAREDVRVYVVALVDACDAEHAMRCDAVPFHVSGTHSLPQVLVRVDTRTSTSTVLVQIVKYCRTVLL